MHPLIVTAAIIRHKGKILISQRYVNAEKVLKWEFPGGKLETGESPEECLIREIKEELNLDIEVKDIFKVVYHKYADKTVLLLCYLCDAMGKEPSPLECNDFRWIDIKDIKEFEFLEADLAIIDKIQRLGKKIFFI